jgi:hypothetical protein
MSSPSDFTTCSTAAEDLRIKSTLDSLVYAAEGSDVAIATPVPYLRAVFCVDTSGSTSGAIMKSQIRSAKSIAKALPAVKIYGWGSNAKAIEQFDALQSDGGGTRPESLIEHLQKELSLQCLVLYTDGEVSVSSMEEFRRGMSQFPAMPVIVVLTLAPKYVAESSTVESLKRQVSMSVPEGVLSLASHALIVLNLSSGPEADAHRVLMSSGEFARHFPAGELQEDTLLSTLRRFNFDWLNVIRLRSLPAGCVQLPNVPKLVDLYRLLAASALSVDEWSALLRDPAGVALLTNVFTQLSARIMLPRVNTSQFHDLLVRVQRAASIDERSIAIGELRKRLAVIAVDPALKGSDQHRQLLAEYNALRGNSNTTGAATSASSSSSSASSASSSSSLTALRRTIANALSAIASYKADATAIVLGSNRANRATVVTEEQLDEVGDCVQIEECPIFLCSGPACILLRAPRAGIEQVAPAPAAAFDAGDQKSKQQQQQQQHQQQQQQPQVEALLVDGVPLEQYCSTDEHMENPFAFGTFLSQCFTPGVYSQEFACDAALNPLTRDRVIGWVPLTKDPLVLLRHLSKIFVARRELWHLVRGWIAAVAVHLSTDQWASVAPIREHILAVCANYVTNDNLKGADVDVTKVPLLEAVRNVLTNYATFLRDRTEADVRAICTVSDVLQPEFAYNRVGVASLSRLVQTFAVLLAAHKRGEPMLHVLLPVDAQYEFPIGRVNATLEGLIAWLFFTTGDTFRGLRLQAAVDQALLDRKFGPALLHAFTTGEVDQAIFAELAFREPSKDDVHFQDLPEAEKFPCWTAFGRSSTQCAYCGSTPDNMGEHSKSAFGPWFFSGLRIVMSAFESLGNDASEEALFRAAVQLLRRRMGVLNMVVHSQFVRNRLLFFIRQLQPLRAKKPVQE